MADGRGFIIFIIILIIAILIIVLILILFVFKQKSSTSSSSTANCSTLPQPTNVQAISLNVTEVQVSWSAIPGTAKYKVYVGTVSQFSPANSIESVLTAETTTIIDGLVLGRTYYILVQAVNACNQGGSLSEEVSVHLGYPSQFKIVSRAQPSLGMKINSTFDGVILQTLCSGATNDNLCIWSYIESATEIVSSSTPLNCMKTIPPQVSNFVEYGSCTDQTYSNFSYNRSWTYDNATGAVCHATVGGSTPCIKSNGPLTAGQGLILAQYDGSPEMQWNIVQA